MPKLGTLLLLVLLLPSAALASDADASAANAETRVFAVRTADAAVAEAVQGGGFAHWIVPRLEGVRLDVGADARGAVEVTAVLLPAGAEVKERLAGLPVELRDDAIVLGGTVYAEARHTLAVRLPDDERTSWVVVGRDAENVADLAGQALAASADVHFYRQRTLGELDYVLYENRFSQRLGRWATTPGGLATADERDDLAARARADAERETIRRPHVVLRVPPGRAAGLTALADRLETAVATLAPRVPVALDEPLEVVVEADFVAQGRRLEDIGETVLSDDGRLYLVDDPDDLDAFRWGVARALLRRAGLAAPEPMEDGAALWLSGGWFGRPWAEWLPDLVFADVLPEAGELLAEASRSRVLWPPVAAAVIDRVPGKTLAERFAALGDGSGLAPLLAAVEADVPRPEKGATRAKPAATRTRAFQHGVSLAMVNGLETGYHAPGVDEQLRRLGELGADAVSLMPFAGVRDPHSPELRFYNRSPGSETDVGLVHAARRAHAHGFRVLWKPHLWVSHESWPGDVEMRSEDDWRSFFRAYRLYVVHHAVLARFAHAELFSIGVELGRTLGREAEWRQMIAAVRQVYPGELTYAGNWWGDYDQAPFWDALDFVGVDAYFPLAHDGDADRARLEEGAKRAVAELRAAAERFKKPVLLTEVGFAARHGAWIEPHKEGGEHSDADQSVAYEVFLRTLGRPPWLEGLYLWKAFSHPDSEGGGPRPDFRFLDRPAESVVRTYFSAR